MIEIVLDGTKTNLEGESFDSIGSLIKKMRLQMSASQRLISSLKINGTELTEVAEELLASQPIHSIHSIEVTTASKSTIAHETIDALMSFVPELMILAQRTAVSAQKSERVQLFNRLLNGIETFYEAIAAVKVTYQLPQNSEISLLEVTLVNVMDRLLLACESRNDRDLNVLLENDLAENFRRWMSQGIPSLLNAIQNT